MLLVLSLVWLVLVLVLCCYTVGGVVIVVIGGSVASDVIVGMVGVVDIVV